MGRTFVSIGGCSGASGGERLIRPGMKWVPKVVARFSFDKVAYKDQKT